MTDLKDNITELSHIPPELGPILKKMGSVVQDEWMTRNGVYLNADERKGSKPLSVIESVDMEIRVGNTRYIIGPADPKKPVVSIPVGMSDKTNTAPVPRDWVVGMLGSALITAFGDDSEVFNIVIDRMCRAIDAASVIDEETGRLSIKQSDLPPVRHAVEVAEGLERMKRVFKSRSAGSPKVNFSITAVTDEPAQEQESMQARKEAVLSSIMPEPEAQECTVTDCPTEGEVNEHGRCEACEEASGVADERMLPQKQWLPRSWKTPSKPWRRSVLVALLLDTQGTQTSSESSWTLLTLKTWKNSAWTFTAS